MDAPKYLLMRHTEQGWWLLDQSDDEQAIRRAYESQPEEFTVAALETTPLVGACSDLDLKDDDEPPRVYLAGPMRGLPDYNFPAFHAAAKKIRAMGYAVYNPAEWEKDFDPAKDSAKPIEHYMEHDLPQVCRCDIVAVLPGWEKSEGASIEVAVARALNKPIYDATYPWCETGDDYAHVIRHGAVLVQKNDKREICSTESILEEAQRVVDERGQNYGHPKDDFTRTAKIWSAVLGTEVTASQVALCLCGVKIARECHAPKRDNRVDLAGYANCLDLVETDH